MLVAAPGSELRDVVQRYTRAWRWLLEYDEKHLSERPAVPAQPAGAAGDGRGPGAGLGAIVSLLLLWALYLAGRTRMAEGLTALTGAGDVQFLGSAEASSIILAALAVGALTGTVVSRAVR